MRVIIIIIFIIIIFFFCNSDDEIEDFIRKSSESSKLFYFSLNIIDNKKSKLEVGGIDQINKEKERGDGSAGEVVTNGMSRTLDLNSRKASVSSSSSFLPYGDCNVINENHSIANTDTDASTLNNRSSNNKSENDALETLKESTRRNKEDNEIEIIMTETENNRKYLTDTADISDNIIKVRSNSLRIHESEDSTNRDINDSNNGKDMEKAKVRTFILKYFSSQSISIIVVIMMIKNMRINIVIDMIILIITVIIIIVITNIDTNMILLTCFQYFQNHHPYNYLHL